MIVCVNGKFVDEKKALISALDNGFLYGDGVYETMRAYEGVIFELEIHMKRLQKSADALGLKLAWTVADIEKWSKQIVALNKLKAARVRITLSRGENGFDFITCKKPTLLIHGEKLVVDSEIYKKGVSVVTMKLQRILPEVKTVGLTHMIQAYRAFDVNKIAEAIIVDKKDFVREGASTNVFIVKEGVIFTPKTNILMGTTRNLVIKLARGLRHKVVEKDFKVGFLVGAEEIFLTNRPRQIIPVTTLNGKKVGKGKVGVVTKKIMQAYGCFVASYVKKYL